MESPRLRRARADDAAIITRLALRSKQRWGYSDGFMDLVAFDLTLTAEDLGQDYVEVLESETGLIGFYRPQRRDECAWLEDLFIDPDAVRSGHGRRLFERAADVARDWGYRILEFDSDPHAETFYLHLGAERIGMKASTLIVGRELPVMRYVLKMG